MREFLQRQYERFSPKHLLLAAVVLIVCVPVVGLSVRTARLSRTVQTMTERLGREIERQNQLTQLLESNQRTATQQLQETRNLLNLPTTTFRFSDDAPPSASRSRNEPTGADLLFHGAQRLVRELRIREAHAHVQGEVDGARDVEMLRHGDGQWTVAPGAGENPITFSLAPGDGELRFIVPPSEDPVASDQLLAAIRAAIETAQAAMEGEEQSPPDMVADVTDVDVGSPESRRVSAARATIEDLAQEDEFQKMLGGLGLTLSRESEETLDFFMYPLPAEDQQVVGYFGVLKFHGEIYLLDEDAVMIASLETLFSAREQLNRLPVSSGEQSRTLPSDFPVNFSGSQDASGGTSLLLVGTHETKADAIILVHLSPNRHIRLISIPRDIFFRGRKLSDHYEVYGVAVFMQRMEELLQRDIHGYVSIDMYAFIEVVDLLGGITMTLDEPLVDPTYRVRDNGVWSTLFYPAGTHTLSGIEALRIARSRATTTDFGRSERQHEMLLALRQRFNELHAGNLDRLYGLVDIFHRYVDTNISAFNMAQYLLVYRDAPIVNRAGMTFDNVLFSTYSNVHQQGLSFDDLPEDFFMGQWILLPRNEDWNVIPWFIERELQR